MNKWFSTAKNNIFRHISSSRGTLPLLRYLSLNGYVSVVLSIPVPTLIKQNREKIAKEQKGGHTPLLPSNYELCGNIHKYLPRDKEDQSSGFLYCASRLSPRFIPRSCCIFECNKSLLSRKQHSFRNNISWGWDLAQ